MTTITITVVTMTTIDAVLEAWVRMSDSRPYG